MKGDKVPPTDHIARLCYGRGVEDGEILGPAFLPRSPEPYISVNWLEYLNCSNRISEITEVRKRYDREFKLKKKYKIAILNVGIMCSMVEEGSHADYQMSVTHEPTQTDDSHCGVWGFSDNDRINLQIAELIRLTVLEDYPAI